jgi:D-alanyl-D-alanine carboxypeptidase/D-alanyl-D-alanine-endopeptidase (penicillin-binding protein 4)
MPLPAWTGSGRSGRPVLRSALILAVAAGLLAPAAPVSAGVPGRAAVVGRLQAAPGGPSTLAAAALPRTTVPGADPFTASMTSALTETASTSRYLGSALSGLVVDPADGSIVWRHNDGLGRMPASTQKLVTAFTVLGSMAPDTTLTTTICQSEQTPSTIFVRGGGDPSLSPARLQTLAMQAADQLKLADQSQVSLYLDGSLFPAPTAATGWVAGYLRSDVQYVRGLTLAGYRGKDGRLAVGKALVIDLKAQGITVTGTGMAITPNLCTTLGTTSSAPVGTLIAEMLGNSDNDYAEFLLRHAALARGFIPSWRGALDNQTELLTRAGIPTAGLRVFDGSGLSRADRMPVATLSAVLGLLREDPRDAAIVFAWGAIPRAGQSGTLIRRFSTPYQVCARGHIEAKTGTLVDAVALAGVAHGADGHDRVFVLLDNGLRRTTAVGSAIDTLATMVVGCHFE